METSTLSYDYERAGSKAKAPLKLWLRLFSCATLIEAEIGAPPARDLRHFTRQI